MPVRKWAPKQQVNTTTASGQFDPSIATLDDRGYVVAFVDAGRIRAQRFSEVGAKVGGEFLVSSFAGSSDPSVSGLDGGGFVISSTFPFNGDLADHDITATVYGSNGAAIAFPSISSGDGNQAYGEVTRNGSGFAAAYANFNLNVGDIVLKLFNSAGAEQNSVIVNNNVTANAQYFPDVAELANGTLAVVWSNGNNGDIRMRVFDASGGAVTTDEMIVNVAGLGGAIGYPQVTPLARGGFVVTWDAPSDQRARIFDDFGNAFGSDFSVGTTLAGIQERGQIAGLAGGGFVIVWVDFDNSLIRGQVYNAVGTEIGPEFTVDVLGFTLVDDGGHLGVTGLADGRFVVTWTGGDDSGVGVFSQILDPRDGVVDGTNDADRLWGNPALNDEVSGYNGADLIDGMAGDDFLYGGAENDIVIGGAGADFLYGEGGTDDLRGGAGTDALDGGAGIDIANYTTSTAGVTAALDGSLAGTGDAAGDSFLAVEYLKGSNAAGSGDTLRGDGGANSLYGNAGNDNLNGLAGADKLVGGLGTDTLAGGSGNDQFIYNLITELPDALTDFSSNAAGNNDVFLFKGSVFGGLPAGTITAAQFQSSTTAAAANAGIRFFYETDTRVLRFDADGSGAGSTPLVIATLQVGATMTFADISIF